MGHPSSGSARRWTGIAVSAPLVLFAGCAALVTALENIQVGRRRLDSIAVSPDACPYLDRARLVVADLTDLWQKQLFPPREQLLPKLDALVLVLSAAAPHVPARIAERFDVVIRQSRIGRDTLVRDRNASYAESLAKGLNALADASDLIGTLCGYTLYTGFAI